MERPCSGSAKRVDGRGRNGCFQGRHPFLPASGSVNAAFHRLSIIIGIKGEMDSRLCKDSLMGRRL